MFRKALSPALLSLAMQGALALISVNAQNFQSVAPFAALVDYDTGSVLYDKNAEQPMEPASTTKLLTAEIVFDALKQGRAHLTDSFTVSQYAWRTGGAPAHGSTSFLALHSRVAVEDLLRGMLIQSGNDAAIALAEGIGGSVDKFVETMNQHAAAIGMAHSHFTNPWGDNQLEHRVTPNDMARLAAYLIRTYPEYYGYFSEREFTWNKIRQLNRNPLLTQNLGADGLKTGETEVSGFGLVGSAIQNGRRLIIVINGLKNAQERSDEARRLLEHGFNDFEPHSVFAAGQIVGAATVYGGASGEAPLMTQSPITVFEQRGATERLTAQITYKGPLIAPIAAGLEVARLKIYRGDMLLHDGPLKTASAVAVGSLAQRALDALYELAGDAVRRLARKKI